MVDARYRETSTGRYIDRLLEALQEQDRRNAYTVLLAASDRWQPQQRNFAVRHAAFSIYSWGEQWGLWRLLRQLRADLVHFAMPQQPLLYRGRAVTTVHDLTLVRWRNYRSDRWLRRVAYDVRWIVFTRLLRRVARRSSAVITPSVYTKAELAGFADIEPSKITVTYEAGESLDEPPAPVDALLGRRFVLYVGNAFPYKNVNRLVTAWLRVAGRFPNTVLVLVGRRSTYYDDLAATNPPATLLLHDIPDGELRWLYENACFFVFPSLSEGFGLPGLEAMVHGCPVLASRETCLPEVYGDAARYFDPYDLGAMAAAMADLLSNPDLRDEMSRAGLVHAGRFSWARTAAQTLAVYERVLAEGEVG